MNPKPFTPIVVNIPWSRYRQVLIALSLPTWRAKIETGISPTELWAAMDDDMKRLTLNELPHDIQQQLWLAQIEYRSNAEMLGKFKYMLEAMQQGHTARTAHLAMEVCQYAMYLDWTWYQVVVLLPFHIPTERDPYTLPDWSKCIGQGRWFINDPLPIVFPDVQDSYCSDLILTATDGTEETVKAVPIKPSRFQLMSIPTLARQYALHDNVSVEDWRPGWERHAVAVYIASGNRTVGVDFGALREDEIEGLNNRFTWINLVHAGSDEREPYVRVFNIENEEQMRVLSNIVEGIKSATIF